MKKTRRNDSSNIFQNIIYAICDPINNYPFYIGKSTTGLDRPFRHIKNQSHSDAVNIWMEDLKSNGRMPIIIILEYTNVDSVLEEKERFWIQRYIDFGHTLLNETLITPVKTNNVKISPNSFTKELAKSIKANRVFRNLTQKELAEKCVVNRATLVGIEGDKRKIDFGIRTISRLLNFFDLQLSITPVMSDNAIIKAKIDSNDVKKQH